MTDDPPPSLIGRLARPGAPARKVLGLLGVALLVLLAMIAIVATIRAGRIESATRRLIADTPAPAAGQAEAQAMAHAFARPRLATTLAGLAEHLPAGTLLAEASRNRDGSLRIALDTADPDELRPLLAADPWFEAFHERAQERRAEGRIRVTLVEDAR
jgi:hypothetical protein